ncbi:MAG: (2Fe-2S)-binding protein [Deltaproteobacteria bacterium]|nr:(2Fe-2S)-binding protein [Deltaproteobacteria bacterium]
MACQTKVRPQMQIKFPDVPQTNLSQSLSKSSSKSFGKPSDIVLCPCTGLTVNEVLERIQNSKVKSPEALFSALKISGGRCHGLICREPLKQIFMEKHMDVSEWIDWHFPWSDWKLNAGD